MTTHDEPVAWYVERVAPSKRDNGVRIGPWFIKAEAQEWVNEHHVLRPLYPAPQSAAAVSEAQIEAAAKAIHDAHEEVFKEASRFEWETCDPYWREKCRRQARAAHAVFTAALTAASEGASA